jgi:hypothetical protein
VANPPDVGRAEPAACPRCGATGSLTPIVYGLVGPDLLSDDRRGDVVLGGCLVFDDDPTHLCRRCDTAVRIES